jgi:hypothetical protein
MDYRFFPLQKDYPPLSLFDKRELDAMSDMLEALADALVEGDLESVKRWNALLKITPARLRGALKDRYEVTLKKARSDWGVEDMLTKEQQHALAMLRSQESVTLVHQLGRASLRKIHAIILRSPELLTTISHAGTILTHQGVGAINEAPQIVEKIQTVPASHVSPSPITR